jgi:hypothetical protein
MKSSSAVIIVAQNLSTNSGKTLKDEHGKQSEVGKQEAASDGE